MELLRLPPESTVTRLSPLHRGSYEMYGRFIDTQPIPRDCIDDIVVNQTAVDLIPTAFHQLLEKDSLEKIVQLSSFRYRNHGRTIQVPYNFGRALPLAYTNIPYADNLYGTAIVGKGGGPSGFLFSQDNGVSREPDEAHATLGLFGVRDAEYDTKVSNALLANGGRAALSLGHIIFKPREYKDLLLSYWNDVRSRDIIEDAFNKVEQNGDTPAYHIRMGGSVSRLNLFRERKGEMHDTFDYQLKSKRRALAIQRGVQTMLQSKPPGEPDKRERKLLNNLAQGNRLQEKDVPLLRPWLDRVFKQELNILEIVNRNGLFVRLDTGQEKDVDFTLTCWDFEKPGLNRPADFHQLKKNWSETVDTYHDYIFRNRIPSKH